LKPAVGSEEKAKESGGGGPVGRAPGPKRRGPDEDEHAEDLELVRRIKAGEKDLYSQLVMKYHGRIYTVVSRILASPEDAEEATQDAFVAAYRKIDTFREQARFYSWLYRIATNHALNRIRANKARREKQKESLDTIIEDGREKYLDDPNPNPGRNPGRACEESEWLELVDRALADLAPMYRSVVVLRDVEGLTYEEISLETGLALGTVKSRLHAGRAGLRKILEDYGVSPA
jgi:RNA polymerase sigma-70 factor (ECF subfamily)